MSQICRLFGKVEKKTLLVRFASNNTQCYNVLSPLNKFNSNRLYSTTSSSSSSSNVNESDQPINLGYIKAAQEGEEALLRNYNSLKSFRAIEEFESFEPGQASRDQEKIFSEEIHIETPKIELNDQQAPYHQSSKKIEKSLRSYLNRFFVKVHPDIFHNDENSRAINQASLTKLNNLLRTLEEYVEVSENEDSVITKLDKIPTKSTLNFIVEYEEDGGTIEISQEFNFIDAPESILTSKSSLIQYVTELRFSVYRQIYSLIEKSGIGVSKAEKELLRNPEPVPKEIYDDPWEEYYSEDTNKKSSITTDLDEFIKQFPVTADRLVSHHLYEHQRLMDQFQENRVFFYFGENAKGDMDIMRSLNLREEAEHQIVHLKENLLSLEFQEWSSLPIAIVNPEFYNIMEPTLTAKGFVVLERNFNPVKTLSYIKNVVIPKTTNNFKNIFSIVDNNYKALEEKTIKLENLLGSTSVIVENLFSINQKTMEKVRDTFNNSLTQVGELKIPMIQLLDSVKAETWRQLPLTNFKDIEFQRWKINNVITNTQEKIEYITSREEGFVKDGRVPLQESKITKLERIHNTMEKLTNPDAQPTTSDIREKPLTLVNRNQFDSLQTTPFITESLSAVERLTKLFEIPTDVPFLLSQKPIPHPLVSLKERLPNLKRSNIDRDTPIHLDTEIADESNSTIADKLDLKNSFLKNKDFENEMKQLDRFNTSKTSESKEKTIQESKQYAKDANIVFGQNNIIPIEATNNIKPEVVSTIDFMSKTNINDTLAKEQTISTPTTQVSSLNIKSILKDAKNSPGISSDLDDFFSKLSNLDEQKPQKPVSIFQRIQDQLSGASEESSTTDVEWKESIQFISQRLSDFKWKNINLIVSDHYQFIISHDNKSGFCFIPSNFIDKELFIFLNSIQDSFDLINGGSSDKAAEEYNLKSLLAVEKAIDSLKHLYRFKSILIDNTVIPGKPEQYSLVNCFSKFLQSESVSPDENITLKNICPYADLVFSNSFAIQFLDENGNSINENDTNAVQQSKHVEISFNQSNTDIKLFLKFVFVTLSENSEFFKDIISRTYQIPAPPPTPSIDDVKNTINEIYGFNRITSGPYSVDINDVFEDDNNDDANDSETDKVLDQEN
ncbi:hypothetical protein ACTFIZ_010478 [Dictyostelium cf. discoideum]